ncbi:hypothetical protein DFJ74DRAFT_110805 [Hyaloraphidium curvatum]|nr:hypothetical protein DFJ74DRAFT_110805 [Hyaloraphidium curvatum]
MQLVRLRAAALLRVPWSPLLGVPRTSGAPCARAASRWFSLSPRILGAPDADPGETSGRGAHPSLPPDPPLPLDEGRAAPGPPRQVEMAPPARNVGPEGEEDPEDEMLADFESLAEELSALNNQLASVQASTAAAKAPPPVPSFPPQAREVPKDTSSALKAALPAARKASRGTKSMSLDDLIESEIAAVLSPRSRRPAAQSQSRLSHRERRRARLESARTASPSGSTGVIELLATLRGGTAKEAGTPTRVSKEGRVAKNLDDALGDVVNWLYTTNAEPLDAAEPVSSPPVLEAKTEPAQVAPLEQEEDWDNESDYLDPAQRPSTRPALRRRLLLPINPRFLRKPSFQPAKPVAVKTHKRPPVAWMSEILSALSESASKPAPRQSASAKAADSVGWLSSTLGAVGDKLSVQSRNRPATGATPDKQAGRSRKRSARVAGDVALADEVAHAVGVDSETLGRRRNRAAAPTKDRASGAKANGAAASRHADLFVQALLSRHLPPPTVPGTTEEAGVAAMQEQEEFAEALDRYVPPPPRRAHSAGARVDRRGVDLARASALRTVRIPKPQSKSENPDDLLDSVLSTMPLRAEQVGRIADALRTEPKIRARRSPGAEARASAADADKLVTAFLANVTVPRTAAASPAHAPPKGEVLRKEDRRRSSQAAASELDTFTLSVLREPASVNQAQPEAAPASSVESPDAARRTASRRALPRGVQFFVQALALKLMQKAGAMARDMEHGVQVRERASMFAGMVGRVLRDRAVATGALLPDANPPSEPVGAPELSEVRKKAELFVDSLAKAVLERAQSVVAGGGQSQRTIHKDSVLRERLRTSTAPPGEDPAEARKRQVAVIAGAKVAEEAVVNLFRAADRRRRLYTSLRTGRLYEQRWRDHNFVLLGMVRKDYTWAPAGIVDAQERSRRCDKLRELLSEHRKVADAIAALDKPELKALLDASRVAVTMLEELLKAQGVPWEGMVRQARLPRSTRPGNEV